MPHATAYGLDYSARELSPQEIDDHNRQHPDQPISFLIRYIGYRTNRKCISHYPGALRAHEQSGRLVLLVHQIGYGDFHGGRAAGAAHARTAWADAEREGYPANRPIFFAFDRWLSGNQVAGPLSLSHVWDYLQGAIDVLGFDRVGLYGFFDVIHPAIREQRVKWTWLCGAESKVIDGVDFYQWNNGRVRPGGLECDLNKAYIDLNEIGDDMPSADEVADAVIRKLFETRTQDYDGGERSLFDGKVESLGRLQQLLANDETQTSLLRLLMEREEQQGTPIDLDKLAAALAPATAAQVVAMLPKDDDGSLTVEVDESLIASEVVTAIGSKLGAA